MVLKNKLLVSIIGIFLMPIIYMFIQPKLQTNYNFKDIQPKTYELGIGSKKEFDSLEDFKKVFYEKEVYVGEHPSEDKVLGYKEEEGVNGAKYIVYEESTYDDSVSARREVYRLEKLNEKWTITGLEKTFRCHEGRGHSNYSATGKCY